jgi:hypothetical protein
MTTLLLRNSISRSPLPRRNFSEGGSPITYHYSLLTVLLLALACFGLSSAPKAFGVSPPPDGGYPNNNTAEGDSSLFSLTTGHHNTANGFETLKNNTIGTFNTASGSQALHNNTMGFGNTATGDEALFSNTTGIDNTANGLRALESNTIGGSNVAIGVYTMTNNTGGSYNTVIGAEALALNTTGNDNIALGSHAGTNVINGTKNIFIGNEGVYTDQFTIRIGDTQTRTYIAGIYGPASFAGTPVYVSSSGQLGTHTSSARFKDEIKPMDKASEAVLALKPVTFRYKHEFDPEGIPQFGLVAEEVEKVNPDLVARDAKGEPYTVRYEAVNAMLLNEFLKEHRKVQKLEATAAQQQREFQSALAQQQTEIKALTASVKRQASQIQKVSAQLEVSKATPQIVVSNQ